MATRRPERTSLLESIASPADLRKLPVTDLPQVAQEMRDLLVETVSKTGGHLAPSLGVVELTLALHYVFATPRDRKLHVREMARIAQRSEDEGGLNCTDAMLFDGGHSVNFFVDGDEKDVSVSNGRVPVFVYATRR